MVRAAMVGDVMWTLAFLGLVCLIASVWVGTLADDEEVVFENTREATKAALQLGAAAGPWHGNLAAVETPENPDFRRAT